MNESNLSKEDKKLIEELERERIEQDESDGKNVAEEKICANCHAYLHGLLGDNWKYCPICGTKKGEGKFNPLRNDSIMLYGPEYLSFYKCKKCGVKWSMVIMYTGTDSDEPKYCPNCGTKRIKMYYLDGDPNVIYGGKDITVKDIVNYKIGKIRGCFYSIKRKIKEMFNKKK